MRRLAALFTFFAFLSCSSDDDLLAEDFYGFWSAEGVRLTLSNTRTFFESSCWSGEYAIPIIIDGNDFLASGSLNAHDGSGEMVLSDLRGNLGGDILTVNAGPDRLNLGPYQMRRDQQVTIEPCPPAQSSRR